MGGIPVHLKFDTNNRYMGIGEDHEGLFAFDFNNKVHLANMKRLLETYKLEKIKIWYEGKTIKQKSKSFDAFIEKFTRTFPNAQYTILGWETNIKIPRMIEITNVLLGAEPENYVRMIGTTNLKGGSTLLDVIASSRDFALRPTRKEIVTALTDRGKESDILKVMMLPNSNTREVLDILYGGGYNALRAKYYEGTRGALASSDLYKRVKAANDFRDDLLVANLKEKGGIFLAGDGHIQLLKHKIPY